MSEYLNSPVVAALVTGTFGLITFFGGLQLQDYLEQKRQKIICAVDRTDLKALEEAFSDFTSSANEINELSSSFIIEFNQMLSTVSTDKGSQESFYASIDKINEKFNYLTNPEDGSSVEGADSIVINREHILELRAKRSASAQVFNKMAKKINTSCSDQG